MFSPCCIVFIWALTYFEGKPFSMVDHPWITMLFWSCTIEAVLYLPCFSSYCWQTNNYLWMVWHIIRFERLFLSHQSVHCFPPRLSATPPVWHSVCVSAVLSSLHSASHWYVAINRRQFNLQVCHFTKQNRGENNYWVIVRFVQLSVILCLLWCRKNTPKHITARAKRGWARRTVSWCHVRGISVHIPPRENYSDAFRCLLSHAFRALGGAEGKAKWMWQA